MVSRTVRAPRGAVKGRIRGCGPVPRDGPTALCPPSPPARDPSPAGAPPASPGTRGARGPRGRRARSSPGATGTARWLDWGHHRHHGRIGDELRVLPRDGLLPAARVEARRRAVAHEELERPAPRIAAAIDVLDRQLDALEHRRAPSRVRPRHAEGHTDVDRALRRSLRVARGRAPEGHEDGDEQRVESAAIPGSFGGRRAGGARAPRRHLPARRRRSSQASHGTDGCPSVAARTRGP
jgi:hypothetical protein